MNYVWQQVSMESLKAAMTCIDSEGREETRKRLGFQAPRNVHMYLDGRGPYEARVLLARAAQISTDLNVGPVDFDGVEEQVFLKKMGFIAVPKDAKRAV